MITYTEKGNCFTSVWLVKVCIYNYKSTVVVFDSIVGSSKRDWSFVMNQKGWFCFTGITDEQVSCCYPLYIYHVYTNLRNFLYVKELYVTFNH